MGEERRRKKREGKMGTTENGLKVDGNEKQWGPGRRQMLG